MLRRSFISRAGGSFFNANEYIMRPPANVGLVIVPQASEYIVERLGKYSRTLGPGMHLLVPMLDKIRYAYSKKEMAIQLHAQSCVTRDNVMLSVDSVLFARVVDSQKASYEIDHPVAALVNLAQTTMRAEVGKLTLDTLFAEREELNKSIVHSLMGNANFGIDASRFEIRNFEVSDQVRQSMDLQAEAERRKRRDILISEGAMMAQINAAKGERLATLEKATAEAEALDKSTRAVVDSLKLLSDTLEHKNAHAAVSFRLAEQYLEAFSHMAKEGNSLVLSQPVNDPAAMVAQGSSIFKTLMDNSNKAKKQ